MFKVYWTEAGEARSVDFQDDLSAALAECERQRSSQRAGEDVNFVVLCSENPNSVTKPGVDVTGPDYDWKKRRA